MSKPQSMTYKQWFIKKMSIDLVVSEKIINSVITHQFDSATDALNIYNSVEISGFGTFNFNATKSLKQLDKWNKIKKAYERHLQDETLTLKKRNNIETRLKNLIVSINSLQKKLDENT